MDSRLKAIIEAFNYTTRQFFFVLLGLLAVVAGNILLGINLQTGVVSVDWVATFNILKACVLFSALTAFVGAVDKFKHIFAKDQTPKALEGKSAGIVPQILQIKSK